MGRGPARLGALRRAARAGSRGRRGACHHPRVRAGGRREARRAARAHLPPLQQQAREAPEPRHAHRGRRPAGARWPSRPTAARSPTGSCCRSGRSVPAPTWSVTRCWRPTATSRRAPCASPCSSRSSDGLPDAQGQGDVRGHGGLPCDPGRARRPTATSASGAGCRSPRSASAPTWALTTTPRTRCTRPPSSGPSRPGSTSSTPRSTIGASGASALSAGRSAALVRAGGAAREGVVVATKGGFLPFDGPAPPGLLRPGDLVAGSHCMTPRYLEDQIERSRVNLDLETIDIYYLHNPETQLGEVPRREVTRAAPRGLRVPRGRGARREDRALRHGDLERLPPAAGARAISSRCRISSRWPRRSEEPSTASAWSSCRTTSP